MPLLYVDYGHGVLQVDHRIDLLSVAYHIMDNFISVVGCDCKIHMSEGRTCELYMIDHFFNLQESTRL